MDCVEGRSAIVTGAAVGVGRAIAEALAGAGAHVTLCDLADGVVEVARELQSGAEGRITGLVCDVSDPDSVRETVDQVVVDAGGVDILVNNAGVVEITSPTDPWEKSLQDFDHVVGTNLRGPFLFGRACIPLMVEKGSGDVVNIASDHIHTCGWPDPVGHSDAELCPWRDVTRPPGWAGLDLYDASKWALNGLTQNWARMLRADGIRVNNICLGATDSQMQRGFFGYADTPPPDELLNWWMKGADVAAVILEMINEGPTGRSGDNVGLWLGHPTTLPAPSPVLNVAPDFTLADLADLTWPPGPR